MINLNARDESSPSRLRVLIVGASGSIGAQAVDVIRRSSYLKLVGVVVGSNQKTAQDLADEFTCEQFIADSAGTNVIDLTEDASHLNFIKRCSPDIILNAAVGVAGLPWTVGALNLNVRLALANKESLVAGGLVVGDMLRAAGDAIVPVDSEHAALHQLMQGRQREQVDELLITASGGPFRGKHWAELESVTPEAALAHPTWSMGPKNSLDSASLMNKGLELIEARYLFDWPAERIRVAIQATSILHAGLRLVDGNYLMHVSDPDMRRSISYALHHPRVVDIGLNPTPASRISGVPLEDDPSDFPAIALARRSVDMEVIGGPTVYNAANEVAGNAFLRGELKFTDITAVVDALLWRLEKERPVIGDLQGVLSLDAKARVWADEILPSMGR